MNTFKCSRHFTCQSRKSRQRKLGVEALEDRHLLSQDGLVPVGQQPTGALTDKVVYIHAGHGWTADNLNGGAWTTQRGETFEMVEDLGNVDQMTYLADYLFRAGATVVPLRPVGTQPHEVVLDNDDPGVTFVGAWSNATSTIYFGDAGDVPYRFATSSATETAYARYRPNLPAAGFYPVYGWVRSGTNRDPNQLFRVHHAGGSTEVTVNQRMVGNGLVYLGTYYFQQGTGGYVDVSNRSNTAGTAVIADMIRFGNGVGDINRGNGVSGQRREDEAGLYWVKWHVDRSQGIPDSEYRSSSDDRNATVSLSPRYSEFMNSEGVGTLSDRAFVSFHSNAGGGSARGVLGLYNGNNDASTATPNQFLMANTIGREINDDLVAQNGQFEHPWDNNSTVTLDRSDIEFGEINNLYIHGEFDATILETGFHDNQQDAEMLRDPRVRDALGRATYQGLLKYFRAVDGGTTPLVMLPGPVTNPRAETQANGVVKVSWTPPVANAYGGDVATGYRIYSSWDGYGFDGGTYVAGGTTHEYEFSGLDRSQGVHYFRIVAENAGGQSRPSEVLAALPSGSTTRVLIVNGFDRLDRSLNPRQSYLGGVIDRVRPRQSNSFDYAVQAAEAIEHADINMSVSTTSNEPVESGLVNLSSYAAVIWLSGEESSTNDTFSALEQSRVQAYLSAGGKLFVSGAEIGWDLDQLNNGRSFYNNVLRADYVADDAATYQVSGVAGGIFQGLGFSFDNGTLFYNVDFPDVIAPLGGAVSVLSYSGGIGGTAAIAYQAVGPGTHVVNFGFPFETINSASARDQVMARVLDYFGIEGTLEGDFDGDGDLDCQDVGALTREIAAGTHRAQYDVTLDGLVTLADLDRWVLELRDTLFGDADLNGSVDGSDFGIWNANKFTAGTDWCSGDFNADGLTDGSDFGIWNAQKFQSAARTGVPVPPRLAEEPGNTLDRTKRTRVDRIWKGQANSPEQACDRL